ncbi:hypothetical protein [Sphingomonas sp.]|uniref:hypothetical protein n=1 Tax=Sphingomonas sp. TaxID=28214 RepID=UPI0035BC0AB8
MKRIGGGDGRTHGRTGPSSTCAALLGVLACTAANAGQARPDRHWIKDLHKPPATATPVAGLPHAGTRTFATLDEYLAWLRDFAAPTGRAWYREVRPGLFRLETGNLRPAAPPRLFTRDELERRFGFRR